MSHTRTAPVLYTMILLGLMGLGGCGQKGDLYLPSDPPPEPKARQSECRTEDCEAQRSAPQTQPESPNTETVE